MLFPSHVVWNDKLQSIYYNDVPLQSIKGNVYGQF